MKRRNNTKANFAKARNIAVTNKFLNERAEWSISKGYSKQKWIIFCEALLAAGFSLSLYEARKTWSKYITVSDGKSQFKVRFSNHRPNKRRELGGDCDFFVGVTHTGTRTTEDALNAISEFFGVDMREQSGAAA